MEEEPWGDHVCDSECQEGTVCPTRQDERMNEQTSDEQSDLEDDNYCCRGECCAPGSWCCGHAGPHEHDLEDDA